jgi:hypothetical protein
MKREIIALTGCFFVGAVALASPALAQQKTAKACAEEWRANKAENQAKKITEKAYVAQCRAGAESSVPSAPSATVPRPTTTTEKTAKACAEEWRANKSENQTKKITEKEYVAQCRTGGVVSRPTLPPPTDARPTAPGPAESTKTSPPSRNTIAPTARSTGTPTASPTGAGQYSTEAQAKIMCLTDTVVWVNLSSKIYHFSGHKDYGHTKSGAYMCQKSAEAAGTRAAKNEKR